VSERVDQTAGQDHRAPSRPRRRRTRAWVVAAAGVVVVGGYATAALALGGTAPRGTTVLGTDLGGKDRAEVRAALAGPAAAAAATPVALRVSGAGADVDASLAPRDAGLRVDVPATAAQVTEAAWDPRELWDHLVGGGPQRPAVAVDRAALTAALTPVADGVRTPAVEGAVTFRVDGTAAQPVVQQPAKGRDVDVAAAADAVAQRWPVEDGRPVTVAAQGTAPGVDAAEVAAAVDALAVPAVAGPLVVAGGGKEASLAPAAFAPALAVRPVDGRMRLVVDGAALAPVVVAAQPGFAVAAQDARIEVRGGVPAVVPAVDGTAVPAPALATAVAAALTPPASSASPAPAAPVRRAEVALTAQPAAVTTKAVQDLGIVERISTFSTTLTPDADRTDNIRIAAASVDGTVVAPGAEFSLNDTVGERTPARGFHKAPVISGGKLVDDYGGGVSQLSTTLFNNVFFAGLDELEHKPHSFYISRYPEGREATIDWRSIDNRFRNDSGHGVYVEAGIVGNQVTVSFYGTRFREVRAEKGPRTNVTAPTTVYDTSASCSTQAPHAGFRVRVTRIMTPVGGGAEQRENFDTTYNAVNRIVCGPDPAARPAPTPAPAPTTPAPAPVPPPAG